LNTYLVRVEDNGWRVATKELNAIRDKKAKLHIWKALLERLEWLHCKNPKSVYFSQLHDVNVGIEKWKLALSENDLIELLARTGELSRIAMPYCVVPHLMSYVSDRGLTPRLSEAIREFTARVRDIGYSVNQTTLQLLNSRLDMLAWRDEWNEVDLDRCWSERIRASYRKMGGLEREHWRKLLHSIDGDEGVRPAPKWLKESAVRIGTIGDTQFRARLLEWLRPLRPGTTHRLSREGSYILRSLLWLTPMLDPEAHAIVAGIPQVEFKPKRNGEKVINAATSLAGISDPPAAAAPLTTNGLAEIAHNAIKVALRKAISSQFAIGEQPRLDRDVD
jgi:hypothetical protein